MKNHWITHIIKAAKDNPENQRRDHNPPKVTPAQQVVAQFRGYEEKRDGKLSEPVKDVLRRMSL